MIADGNIRIRPDEFSTLLSCSVRYALGRHTYIVNDVVMLIEKYAKYMSTSQQEVMRKDIKGYLAAPGAHAHDCDIKDWQKALEVLK